MTTLPNPVQSARPEEAPASGVISLRDLLNVIFFYRRLVLLLLSGLVLAGLLATLLIPPLYSSRARLLTLGGGVYDMQPADPNNAREVASLLAADVELQLLQSSALHRTVVRQETGQNISPELFEKRLRDFEDHLKISKLETGNVIELSFRDRDPQHAADQLTRLLSAYFGQRAEVLTSGRVGFLTAQRDRTRAQLDSANREIESFERSKGVVDIQAQIASAVSLNGLLRQQEAQSAAAVADARRTEQVLNGSAAAVPGEVQLFADNNEAAHTLGIMEAALFAVEAKRADLASRYMVTSPFVKQADAQIAALKADIAQQTKQLPVTRRVGYNAYKDTANDRLSQARATAAGEQARRSVLSGELASSQQRLNDLIAVNAIIARLTSQRDLLADAAKADEEQLAQARTQQNQAAGEGTTNVRVIEPPSVPRRPVNPRLLFLAATLLAAVLITLVTLVVVSSLRETFLTPGEAERALHLPVLCDVLRRNPASSRRREFGRVVAAMDSVSSGVLGKILLLLTAQNEEKGGLVARSMVEALEPRSPGRVAHVHMTEDTAVPGDSEEPGGRYITEDGVIHVGMTMTRARLKNLFEELRSTFDYVVVTAPPASSSFSSLELTTVADLSLLLINAETTRRPVAQSVLAQAGDIGGSVDGLVMTGRRMYIPAWLYRLVLGHGSQGHGSQGHGSRA